MLTYLKVQGFIYWNYPMHSGRKKNIRSLQHYMSYYIVSVQLIDAYYYIRKPHVNSEET